MTLSLNKNIGVLMICFNRPEEFKKSLDRVLLYNPKKIYIHIDGPRNENDKFQIEKIIKLINSISFEFKIFRQTNNLGCKKGVQFALDWFFKKNNYGLIVEDDILISEKFVQMVNYSYKNHFNKIACGYSELINSSGKLVLCDKLHVWGWSCSKNIYKMYNHELPSYFKITSVLYKELGFSLIYFYYLFILFVLKKGKIDTWDYQLQYSIFENNIKVILPPFPLNKNLGFNSNATHTSNEPDSYLDYEIFKDKKVLFEFEKNRFKHSDFLKVKFIDLIYLSYKLFR